MTFTGFSQNNFATFNVPGLEERMKVLIEGIRPKLEYLGREMAPTLTTLTGDEMFPHVAKHARRTVNPPNDTWVAWANDKRGYKKHPHFQVGLWSTHLFVWFALIYESPLKEAYASAMLHHMDKIYNELPPQFEWSWDHMNPRSTRHDTLSKTELEKQLTRVINVKNAELLCGITIPNEDPILQDGSALMNKITATFEQLAPLYSIVRSS